MKKNLILGFGTSALMLSPIMVVTSCGEQTDIAGLKEYFSTKLREDITKKANEIKNSNDEVKKNLLNQNVIQITSAGTVNDKSFNQMTLESMTMYTNLIGVQSKYLETKSEADTDMHPQYDKALEWAKNDNYKIWILTGFQHARPFSSWIAKNKEKVNEYKVKIVAIDWDASSFVDAGHALSLNFRTQESSFLAGYCIARFLGENYSGADNKDKRIFNTTSGDDASGSTNFNYGFLTGIKAWNDEQTSDDKKVSSNIYTENEKVWLKTTYTADNNSTKNDFELSVKGNGEKIFKEKTPTIVMPVAGNWSKTAANIIKNTDMTDKQWVVGVDTNMAISYGSSYSKYFITSSEKRIGITVFKALAFLTGITQELKEEKLDSIFQAWTMNSKEEIAKSDVATNYEVNGGLKDGFVAVSKSTISDTALANKFDGYVKEAYEKFFGDKGSLLQGLEAKKQEYENALKQGLDTLNEKLFTINNVLACGVTRDNQKFFNAIVTDINKWLK